VRKHQHPACNSVLGAPPGTPIDECAALPIMRGTEHGITTVTSFWTPSPEELEVLVGGGTVAVVIMGITHAPIRVEVAR